LRDVFLSEEGGPIQKALAGYLAAKSKRAASNSPIR